MKFTRSTKRGMVHEVRMNLRSSGIRSSKSRGMRIYEASLLAIAIFICCLPTTVVESWSASEVVDIAVDFFNPSNDDRITTALDPLMDSTDDDRAGNTKVNAPTSQKDEFYIIPMLSISVGDNNQVMEYMTAEIIARATGRKLCLSPFFSGPKKHTGKYSNGGLWMHERFDMNVLQKFVNLTSIDICGRKCGMTVGAFWWLRRSSASMLPTYWKSSSTATTHDLANYVRDWQSVDDMQRTLSELDNVKERCVALGGLFPGLRWRGAYLAASKYMTPSPPIAEVVDRLQALAFGRETNYLAVHWRFEESLCKETELGENVGGGGLCFLRCGDAAVIDSGLHAEAMGLPAVTKATLRSPVSDGDPRETNHTIHQTCRHVPDTTKVIISKTDLIAAILEKVSTENVSSLFIATDGWLRGQRAQTLVKEVVQEIRIRGLKVAGLWRLPDLPNIILKGTDAQYVDQVIKSISNLELSGHILSKVEQEMCFRSKAFMGSGESTWSLVVFRERLAQRMVQKAFVDMKGPQASMNSSSALTAAVDLDDNLIISKLMEDSHAAGLQCRYRILFGGSHIRKSVPQEGYQDEAPDTWLDMAACEGQLHKSGSCILSDCFS